MNTRVWDIEMILSADLKSAVPETIRKTGLNQAGIEKYIRLAILMPCDFRVKTRLVLET